MSGIIFLLCPDIQNNGDPIELPVILAAFYGMRRSEIVVKHKNASFGETIRRCAYRIERAAEAATEAMW